MCAYWLPWTVYRKREESNKQQQQQQQHDHHNFESPMQTTKFHTFFCSMTTTEGWSGGSLSNSVSKPFVNVKPHERFLMRFLNAIRSLPGLTTRGVVASAEAGAAAASASRRGDVDCDVSRPQFMIEQTSSVVTVISVLTVMGWEQKLCPFASIHR